MLEDNVNKEKTIESIKKIRENIVNINTLFDNVDKEFIKIEEKLKNSKLSNGEDVVSLYGNYKIRFVDFLGKIDTKMNKIEEDLKKIDTDKTKE